MEGHPAAEVRPALAPSAKAPSATAPSATAPLRYAQAGAYADPANAERAVARLRGLGLPVARSKARVGAQPVQIVLAGPFDALTYKPELGDLAADMAKAKLEEKTGAITGKTESKAKDKLKGLFGK